jgi:hypothetical protein
MTLAMATPQPIIWAGLLLLALLLQQQPSGVPARQINAIPVADRTDSIYVKNINASDAPNGLEGQTAVDPLLPEDMPAAAAGMAEAIIKRIMRSAPPGAVSFNSSMASRYPPCTPNCPKDSSSSSSSGRTYAAAAAASTSAAEDPMTERTPMNDTRQLKEYDGQAVVLETEWQHCPQGSDVKYLDRRVQGKLLLL